MNANTAEKRDFEELKLARNEATKGIAQGLRATSRLIDLADRLDAQLKSHEGNKQPQ